MEEDENSAPVEAEAPPEDVGSEVREVPDVPAETPARSRRPSFGAIRRQLTDDELKSPAVQKLLIDMLEEAEASRDALTSYVDAFHAADKRAAILGEQVARDRAVEIFFGVGVGLGGAIMGLSPFFWDKGKLYGIICVIVGALLIIGAGIGRAVKR